MCFERVVSFSIFFICGLTNNVVARVPQFYFIKEFKKEDFELEKCVKELGLFFKKKNSRKVIIKMINVEFKSDDSGKAMKKVYELYFKMFRK